MTHEVKNNHDAPLSVAGVTITPGGTVGIEADTLRGCLGSSGIKTWLKMGLIEIKNLDKLTGVTGVPGIPGIPAIPVPDITPERQALESRASELEVKGVISRMKDTTLIKKITEAEVEAGTE